MKNFFRNTLTALLTTIVIISWGCKSTEKTSGDIESPETVSDSVSTTDQQNLTELQSTLINNRSKLSDVYTTQKHDMPKAFLKSDSADADLNSNPFDGFRVQILSTRDKQLADSVAQGFRMWSDSTITGYMPNAYVSFRQPFYKVHIGDFHQRNRANSFSKLIKKEYPDAWVVHDRIDPKQVPADTVSISFVRNDSLKADSLQR